MKNNSRFLHSLILGAMMFFFVGVQTTKAQTPSCNCYVFMIIQTSVQPENKGLRRQTNPPERRFYFSNIIYFTGYRYELNSKNAVVAEYLRETVVEPMKQRGILHADFYANTDVKSVVNFSSGEAEAERNKLIEEYKSKEGNIYSFNWAYGKEPNGLATSQPTLLYRNEAVPHYPLANSETNATNNTTNPIKAEREAREKSEQDAELARQNKQIWGFVTVRVQVVENHSIRKKEFSRLYVSEIMSVSLDDFKKFYRTDARFIKPVIWDYFAATVLKAAATHNEEIREPDSSNISYYFNIEGSDIKYDNSFARARAKSYLEELRQREIKYEKDNARPVFFFHWDPSGKNVQTDLQREMKRGDSSGLPY